MDKKTIGVAIFGVSAGLAIYFSFIHKFKNGLTFYQDLSKDSFKGYMAVANADNVNVYKLDKSIWYSKKKGEWISTDFKLFDEDFYVGKNTAGDPLLFKRSEVVIKPSPSK